MQHTSVRIFVLLLACHRAWVHGQIRNQSAWPEPDRNYDFRGRASDQSSEKAVFGNQTVQFLVDGGSIPEVNFDIGPTYAGLLPISDELNEQRKLFFWYMPAKKRSKKLTIWLNGGPGCSSLEGAIQENGPWTWAKGTLRPVKNKYSWTNLTDMLYIDQPIGTGFSLGTAKAKDQRDISVDIMGFMHQFYATFEGTKNKDLYLAGESYAGKYIPYLADHIYSQNDSSVKLQGILLVDPSIADMTVQQLLPTSRFLRRSTQLLGLSKFRTDTILNASQACGFDQYMDDNLVYPARQAGLAPLPVLTEPCQRIWTDLLNSATESNENFNIYKISDTTTPYDVLGFPNSSPYLPEGGTLYFSRPEVQSHIHAPKNASSWSLCASQPVFPAGDASQPVSYDVLGRVLDAGTRHLATGARRNDSTSDSTSQRKRASTTNSDGEATRPSSRTVIVHGLLDFVLIEEGTRLALQNTTWNSRRGFDVPPTLALMVHRPSGVQVQVGTYAAERGLVYVNLYLSGHMVPVDAPAAAYKLMQYVLGDIDSLA